MCGGGGGSVDNSADIAAGTQTVVDKIDETAGAADTAIQGLGSQIGTASDTGTVTATGGSFTTPTGTDADGNVTGGDTVNYGGDTVPVTTTVKGDTEQIIGGQADLSAQIDTRFDTFEPVNVVTQQIDTSDLAKADAMQTGFDTVGTAIGDVKTDTGNLLTGQTNLGTQVAGVGDQVTGLSTDINTLSGDVQTGFEGVNTKLDKAQTDITEYLQREFGLTTEQIAKLSQDVLSGQRSLNEIVTDLQTNQASQFATLTGNQQNMTDSLGGLQTGLSDFRGKYDDDTTLANQTRQQLMDSITGGFETAQKERTATANLAQDERAAQMDMAASQANPAVQNQVMMSNPDTQFAAVARNIALGISPSTEEGVTMQNQFMARLNAIKAALTDGNVNLDPNVANLYTMIANAFDQNGKLIAESIDQQGNRKARALDQSGNLLISTFNNQGQSIDQRNINVTSVMNSVNPSSQGGIMSSNLI